MVSSNSVLRLIAVRRADCFALAAVFLSVVCCAGVANAQIVSLTLDPQKTTVNFTLGDVLHTVHGSFRLKRGALSLDAATGKLSGEIVVDAKSGESGNGMRDRKMHREVLESQQYPEISFRPDHVEGGAVAAGKSEIRVHGMFSIHGAEHELTVPAQVEMFPDHWAATLKFNVPYAKWGMKNPSTLFLRVSESVEIDVATGGAVGRQ
jgi:polyisoprenoid-binding protein YceI